MAIDEYDGEIAGMKIEYQDRDDADRRVAVSGPPSWRPTTPSKAVDDPDVMAYIGPYNSGAAKVSMPILNEAGLLQISPAVTLDRADQEGPGRRPGRAGHLPPDRARSPSAASARPTTSRGRSRPSSPRTS